MSAGFIEEQNSYCRNFHLLEVPKGSITATTLLQRGGCSSTAPPSRDHFLDAQPQGAQRLAYISAHAGHPQHRLHRCLGSLLTSQRDKRPVVAASTVRQPPVPAQLSSAWAAVVGQHRSPRRMSWCPDALRLSLRLLAMLSHSVAVLVRQSCSCSWCSAFSFVYRPAAVLRAHAIPPPESLGAMMTAAHALRATPMVIHARADPEPLGIVFAP